MKTSTHWHHLLKARASFYIYSNKYKSLRFCAGHTRSQGRRKNNGATRTNRSKRAPTSMGTSLGYRLAQAFLWAIFVPSFSRAYISHNYTNRPLFQSYQYLKWILLHFKKGTFLSLPQLKTGGALAPSAPFSGVPDSSTPMLSNAVRPS